MRILTGVIVAAVMLAACGGSGTEPVAPDGLVVFTGVPPMAYVAERIAGGHARVETLMRTGQDPHTFEPGPEQVVALCRARLYLSLGMPFEMQIIGKVSASARDFHVVDTRKGISLRPLESHDGHAGDTQTACEQADPHVWLGPPQLEQLAKNITEALVEAEPAHTDAFRANLAAFLDELHALDAQLREMLGPYADETFYVYHPAFGYFADAYGLRQEAVETGGKSPAPRHIRELIARAQSDSVRVIFVQPQFAPDAANAIAEAIGGVVAPLDDLAKDVPANLEEIARRIVRALGGRSEGPS